MSPELETALEAAKAAADISRRYFRSNLEVTTKADRTPVTRADVECEEAIRDVVLGRFPDHGFFGEETGSSARESANLWLVDPIDGTKAFVRGYPFFSTQIALMRDGVLVLGVSSAALFDELAWAESGQGAWLNDARLHVSETERLASAALSTGNLKSLAASDGWKALGEIVTGLDRVRGYGDFYHYHLLAAGRIDAVVESDVSVLDVAALAVIVQEAGGVFTDLNGRPPDLDTRSVLAANPPLHTELLKRLRGYV
ncbi:MAG TPA: inositol monophosphatase family protein [Woeseiaceae bacterium]|jgi:histidinol-phosphatase|nr:inositol monophosphatase family protein [Woeseiaceae bacterium]